MKSNLRDIVDSKVAKRRELAAKPVGEKLQIVEHLAERALATRRDSSQPLPDEPWQIPASWRWDKLGNVAKVVGGGTPRTDHPEYFGGDIPWITPADLSKHKDKRISRGARNITGAGLEHSGAQMLPAGTVLFSSRAPIGYVAIAENPVATNQGFKSFVLNDELEPDFVYYYLLRARELALALASGTTFLEISAKNAARLPIPVPPRVEQSRIVSELEKNFARLDSAVALVERANGALALYRDSVLADAFAGRLTLKKHDQPKTREIPKDWAMIRLENLGTVVRGASPRPAGDPRYFGGSVPWITVGSLTADPNPYLMHVSHTLTEVGRRNSRYIESGTLLLTNSGATLGVPKITLISGCINDGVAAILNLGDDIKLYLYYFLKSRTKELRAVNQGAAQPNLNTTIIKNIEVPVPPVDERTRLVAELERHLSVIDDSQREIERNLARARNLRQAILERAFSGQL